VVGGEAIRDAGYESVSQALREIAGVVTRRGSEGAPVIGEQIQGIDSRQVLVLIDGQPIVGARGVKSGIVNLDRESTAGLERVEVVKGAASALYGSDAIGGVINIIPREAKRAIEIGGRASTGSFGATDGGIDAGGHFGRGSWFASGGRHQRRSFDLTPSTLDTTGAAFRRTDASARVSAVASASWLLSGNVTSYWNTLAGRSNGELGPQEDKTPSHSQTYGLKAQWRPDTHTTVEARAYTGRYSETSNTVLLGDGQTALEPGDLFQSLAKADWLVSRAIGDQHLIRGGIEWIHDTYRGRNRIRDTDGNSASTRVAWVQYEAAPLSVLTATIGARVDDHSAFGSAVSPKVALSAKPAEWISVRAAFGRGFRAPDLGQLYYRFLNPTSVYQVIGNPLLRPESSSSWQYGFDVRRGSRARVALNLFHNDVRNLIESANLGFIATAGQLAAIAAAERIDPDFSVQLNRLLFFYKNITHARTQGAELEGDLRLHADIRLSGSYAFLDAVNAATKVPLTGRSTHHGTVRIDWTPLPIGLRANLRGTFYSPWIVSVAQSAAGPVATRAAKFALWDLTLAKSLTRGAELFGAIENLTDSQDPNTGMISTTNMALPIYRPEIGRTLRGGVRWSWSR
jgi:outer membrane receptor for ferrienterochelin and colicins